jgi:hypothetical protein
VGGAPNADYAATIPHQTFMIYQLMFAVITPALISGAFAERMKFSAMLLFTVLWMLVVYFPMAHMVWGKGGFLNAALGGRIPCFDFAGGTVVHITSGVSALVTALYLGKRLGYPHDDMKPHNLVISFIGACMLWVGWFGFNAGSALAASSLATSAFVATHFASGRRGPGLGVGGVAQIGQAQRAGRHLRMRGRIGGHHAGFRIRETVPGAADRLPGRNRMLFHGGQSETEAGIRRLPGRLRGTRLRRYSGRGPDRSVRHQRGEPRLQAVPWAWWTATPAKSGTRRPDAPSPGRWPLWEH